MFQKYFCYDKDNHIIGTVEAIDGDAAWLLAKAMDARIDHIFPVWLAHPAGLAHPVKVA